LTATTAAILAGAAAGVGTTGENASPAAEQTGTAASVSACVAASSAAGTGTGAAAAIKACLLCLPLASSHRFDVGLFDRELTALFLRRI